MNSRFVVLGLGILLATAGCLSAPSPPASTDLSPSGQEESDISVTKVSIGPELDFSERDGFGSSRPVVRGNQSTLLVSGSILGVGDSACIDITGDISSSSANPSTLVIRSYISAPAGVGCNMTARHWPYQATLAVDGPGPETIRIRHVNSGEEIDSWTIALNTTK